LDNKWKAPRLAGARSLIAEDEPLIALDIAKAFDEAGTAIVVTSTVHHALALVEHDGLSAAVLDHALHDGDGSPLCQRLNERKLPFVVYTGLGKLHGACAKGVQVAKPENPKMLVSMVARLIGRRRRLLARPYAAHVVGR
jgi:DNA-binding response OmpR family regulator